MGDEALKILIVDDDPFMREILTLILEAGGHSVETAGDGMEAFGMFVSNPEFDVVISDMNMPEMGGLELTRELRGAGVEIPILVLTGDNEASTVSEVMKSGANDCLAKDDTLQDTILTALEKVFDEYRRKRR